MKKIILLNIVIFFVLVITIEVSARIYIYLKYSTQYAGMEMKKMYLNYEPYVMYGKKWRNLFKNYEKSKNNEDINVLLLGGSVAENFPTEILEKKLKKKFKKNVKIFNGAMAGYISTQEMVILIRYGHKLKPDIIININGSNDITQSLREDNSPGTFYLNQTYELFLTKPILAPLIKLLQYSQFYNGLVRLQERYVDFNNNDYSEFISVYMENVENMKLYSHSIGSKYYNFLQPHVLFKSTKHENEKKFTAFDYRSEIITDLYQDVTKNTNNNENFKNYFFDTTQIYNNNKKHIFSDDVHFVNNDGYEILADFISNVVVNKKINKIN